MELKTVKIKDPGKPGDYQIINERDFDPARHELLEEVPPVNIPHSQRIDGNESEPPTATYSATKSDDGWVDGNNLTKKQKGRR